MFTCLCRNQEPGCDDCADNARQAWQAFAAAHPQRSVGELLELAIQSNQPYVVLGITQNTTLAINEACRPGREDSGSPLTVALRAGNPVIMSMIANQPGFDRHRSLPKFDRWSWARGAPVELLLQYLALPGVNVNEPDGNGITLLHEVVQAPDSAERLQVLLSEAGIEIDRPQRDGTTPAYRAALAGNTEAVTRLLARGADVNARNNDNKWTVLMVAVGNDAVAIVDRLVRQPGLDVNATDEVRRTALHIAARRGHPAITALLLRRSEIEVNVQDHLGWTPLSMAAFEGHAEVIRLLLERPDLDVNRVDADRQTPLFHAAAAGAAAVVDLLLADPRTDPSITNRPDRLKASEMALLVGQPDIAQAIAEMRTGEDVLSTNDPWVERRVEPSRTGFLRPR